MAHLPLSSVSRNSSKKRHAAWTLFDTSRAFPRPLWRRSRVAMSIRMSAAMFRIRGSELVTLRIVPHLCLSCARARSLSPFVFASNHWSILASDVMS